MVGQHESRIKYFYNCFKFKIESDKKFAFLYLFFCFKTALKIPGKLNEKFNGISMENSMEYQWKIQWNINGKFQGGRVKVVGIPRGYTKS